MTSNSVEWPKARLALLTLALSFFSFARSSCPFRPSWLLVQPGTQGTLLSLYSEACAESVCP
jgi:hypothetical protein